MLFSFHYFSRVDMGRLVGRMAVRPTVFVDSGGFSAFTQGVSIRIEDYAAWIRKNSKWIDYYANLDEIGDPRATLRNQLRMEALGLRPLPVIHYGCSPSLIERYAAAGYEYQCLGGLVPHLVRMGRAAKNGKPHPGLDWLHECHAVAAGVDVKLHGFGATSWSVVTGFPWASVDSSSWGSGYRFGKVSVFDPHARVWRNALVRNRASIMRLSVVVREYGVDPISLVKDDETARSQIIKASARSWLAAQRHLGSTRIFLADSGGQDTLQAYRAVSLKVFPGDSQGTSLEIASRSMK